MRRFVSDDAGYVAWLADHPDGYVLNNTRMSLPITWSFTAPPVARSIGRWRPAGTGLANTGSPAMTIVQRSSAGQLRRPERPCSRVPIVVLGIRPDERVVGLPVRSGLSEGVGVHAHL